LCIARLAGNNPPNILLLSHNQESFPKLTQRLESLQIAGIFLSF